MNSLSEDEKFSFLTYMNSHFPPSVYKKHLEYRHTALKNMNQTRSILGTSTQQFPSVVNWILVNASPESLKGHALVFTAGGEGERLRLSLLKEGYPAEDLEEFTKATFYLPDFYKRFGTLHINLTMIASFCSTYKIDIPVIVTTGPENSITARVIPQLLKEYNNFGLPNIKVIAQDERIHFSSDNKVVTSITDGTPLPVTHPDETGGPLMKLKQPETDGKSVLQWLNSLGCTKTIVVQATALYDLRLLPLMAEALKGHDCLAVGITRNAFPPEDPYGTFVTLKRDDGNLQTLILEQDVRNELTRTIKDPENKMYLPFNTGFYAFENSLLEQNDLPHFATPPKEVLPDLPKSSKIGYAATDIVPAAKKPVILTMAPDMFGVLKTSKDLPVLSELGKKYGLHELCQKYDK
jgi:hypothetical protein